MTIIVTEASIAAMQARQTQEGDTLRGKSQAYRANSCPRSPVTNVGSTTKQQKRTRKQNKKRTKYEAIVTRMPHVMRMTITGQAANQVTWQSQ
jgi:hypothetical protein